MKADRLVRGTYGQKNGDSFRGCAVACLVAETALERHVFGEGTETKLLFPEVLGWPVWLAHLIDALFEALEVDEAVEFPLKVIKAIPEGVDLEGVETKLHIYLLETWPFERNAWPKVQILVESLIALFRRRLNQDPPQTEEWLAVTDSARVIAQEIQSSLQGWLQSPASSGASAWITHNMMREAVQVARIVASTARLIVSERSATSTAQSVQCWAYPQDFSRGQNSKA